MAVATIGRALLFFALYLAAVLGVAAAAAGVRSRIPWRLLAAMAVLPLLFLGGGVFGERTQLPVDHVVAPWTRPAGARKHNPNLNDVATQFLPWASAARSAWAEGQFPWRDRWNGCGTPLAANGQSAVFSPLNLLAAPLPLAAGFLLAAALKLFLALAGMWLWLKALDCSNGAAALGAIAFAFSFTMIPWLFAPQSGVVCYWPWLLFALERLRNGSIGRRALWLLLAVFVVLPLSGHIESVACGALFAALWLTVRWISGDLPDMPRLSGRIGAAAIAAGALTAFSLLPQILAILSSNRIVLAAQPFWSASFTWLPHGSLWKGGTSTTFLPGAFGDSIDSPIVAGALSSYFEMALGYVGIVAWGCVALLLRKGSPRRREVRALLVVAAVGFGVATGVWPFAEIVGHLPLLRFIFPVRFLPWVALAASAIAAMELDRLGADLRTSRKAAIPALLLILLLAVWVAMISGDVRPLHAAGALASQGKALLLPEAALAAFAAVVLAAATGRLRREIFLPYALAAICGAELWIQGVRLYEYGRVADLFPSTPLIEFLRRQRAPFRVVGESSVLFPNDNVFAGVEDVRTHDPVERRDYVEFLDAACGFPPADYFKFIRDLNAPALDFLNVRFLVSIAGRESPGPLWRRVYSGKDGTVFENDQVLPRVFSPGTVTLVAAKKRLGSWVRNAFAEFGLRPSELARRSDWREHALLLGREAGTVANGRAEVSDYRESTNAASFFARTSEGGAFLVTSLVQDGGWSASDETGRRIAVTLANGPFLALRAPAGDHRLLLKYRPPGFLTGRWISLGGLVAVVLWGVLGTPAAIARTSSLSGGR